MEEHSLNFTRETTPKEALEGTLKRWMAHIKETIETRRHSSGDYEPNYERILREREGQVEVRLEGGYYEGGGGNSWKDWILTVCGPLIVLGIAGVIYQLADMKADQRASLARQEELEKRVDRLETHVYRGSP
jgi:hypothetical protein